MRFLLAIAVGFAISACSLRAPYQDENGLYVDRSPTKLDVRYPAQASAVLNTVAGHFALARGGLPQAERYFDEVARVSSGAPISSGDLIQLDLTRVDIALQLGDTASALKILKQNEPNKLNVQDQLLLAGLLLERGENQLALSRYQNLVTAHPEVDEAQALIRLTLFRLSTANNQLGALDCGDVIGPLTFLVCGRIAEERHNLDQALVYYRLAQEKARELHSIQLDEFRVLLKLNRGEEVRARLQKAYRGSQAADIDRILRSSSSSNASVELLNEIVKLSPGGLNIADLRGKLAALDLRASRPLSALRQLSLVLATDPENDSARYLRASLLASSGRRAEARADLLLIPKTALSYGQSRLLVAQLSRLEGNLDQAQHDLRPYVDAFPGDRLAVLTYLSLLKEQKRYSEGLSLIAAIEASNPQSAQWLELERAHLLKSIGDGNHALAVAESVLAKDDANAQAANFIAYELAELGHDLDRARDLAEKAIATQPDEPFYMDTLGWVLFQKGNNTRALDLLQKAFTLSHGDIVVAEHLGDVLEAIEPGSGQAVYREALEKARDNERSSTSDEEQQIRQRLEKKAKR